MRIRDKHIKRASVTVADRTKKNFKSKGITVYGVTPAELIARLEEMNRRFFDPGMTQNSTTQPAPAVA